jgi:xylulokinase
MSAPAAEGGVHVTPWVLSLDVGTTSVKAAAVTLEGALLGATTAGYATHRPRPSVVEHRPDDWWRAVTDATARLFALPGVERDALIAVGLSGMAATHVLLDAALAPVAPAIIWQDTRATREAALLNEALGPEGVAEAFGRGIPLTASMQAARMRWLHDNAPETLARTRAILGSKDYLLLRLTGELATDRTSANGYCHMLSGELHASIAAATGVDGERIPPRLEPTALGGRVRAEAAAATGIPSGTPVAVGMIDSWCNVLGAAVTRPGDAWDTAGTAEVVGVAAAARSELARTTGMRFLTGVALSYGVTQCGTDAFTWYAETFPEVAEDGAPLQGSAHFRRLDALAATAPAGADGLVFLPYLQGERSPFSDARVRGGFHGAHRGHRREHFVRSVLEGVAFSVRHVLEHHEAAGEVRADRVVVTSGGAKSGLWNQIKADVTGRPFVRLRVSDAGSVGAAILGAVAVGHYALDEAVERMVRVAATVEPQPAHRALYDELYDIYLGLGRAQTDLHHRLADLQTKGTNA